MITDVPIPPRDGRHISVFPTLLFKTLSIPSTYSTPPQPYNAYTSKYIP